SVVQLVQPEHDLRTDAGYRPALRRRQPVQQGAAARQHQLGGGPGAGPVARRGVQQPVLRHHRPPVLPRRQHRVLGSAHYRWPSPRGRATSHSARQPIARSTRSAGAAASAGATAPTGFSIPYRRSCEGRSPDALPAPHPASEAPGGSIDPFVALFRRLLRVHMDKVELLPILLVEAPRIERGPSEEGQVNKTCKYGGLSEAVVLRSI